MSDPYVGEIRMVGFAFPPAGWELCDGRLLSIAEYDTLFTLIGTTYGGDGQSTFGLPNLQSRLPMHQGQSAGGNVYTLGQMAGVESVTLNANQTPLHSHAYLATTGLANQGTPGGNVLGQAPTVQVYAEDTPASAFASASIQPTGGSQPHDNMHPYAVVSFIISLFGFFPSQT